MKVFGIGAGASPSMEQYCTRPPASMHWGSFLMITTSHSASSKSSLLKMVVARDEMVVA